MAKNLTYGITIKITKDGKVDTTIKSLEKGFNGVAKSTEKSKKSMDRMAKSSQSMNKWGMRLIATASAYIGMNFASVLIGQADSIGKVSKKLGISAAALQEYRYAAKIAGVEIRTFDMATQRFTRRVGEAVIGTGEAKEALKTLGIQLTDNVGKTRKTEDMMLDVADALKAVKDPAERLRLAFKLFDSEGVAMINMMTDGAEGLKNMRAEAQRLGIVMSDETIKSAEKATDQFTALSDVFKVNMATGLASALKFMSPVIAGFTEMVSSGTFWTVTVVSVAGMLMWKLVPALIAVSTSIVTRFIPAVYSAVTALMAMSATPIVLSITAVAGAIYLLNKNAQSTPAKIKKITDEIKDLQVQLNQGGKASGRFGFKVLSEQEKNDIQKRILVLKKSLNDLKKGNPLEVTVNKASPLGIIDASPEWLKAAEAGLKKWQESSKSTFEVFSDTAGKAMQSFEDAMVKATMTGKFEFKDMANAIIADIVRIQIRKNITLAASQWLGVALGDLFGSKTAKATVWKTPGAGRADGGLSGYIPTNGGGARSDNQVIAVSGSEYIVNARATAKHLPLLEQINNGSFKRFAGGGGVSGQMAGNGGVKIQVNNIVRDATGGQLKIETSQPVARAGGGFDVETLVSFVDQGIAKLASNGESAIQNMIANNAGLNLNKAGM